MLMSRKKVVKKKLQLLGDHVAAAWWESHV
jgi:hypothetical protein